MRVRAELEDACADREGDRTTVLLLLEGRTFCTKMSVASKIGCIGAC
jgi:hypothetical protein